MSNRTRRKPVASEDTLRKERETLELRRAGVTFDVIADRVGYFDRGGAYKAYRSALARTLQEPAAELRELEQDRLDRLQVGVWANAVRGDTDAVSSVLRIMDRRARLLGLDAPAHVVAEVQADLLLTLSGQLQAIIDSVLVGLGLDPADPAVVRVVSERLALAAGEDGDADVPR